MKKAKLYNEYNGSFHCDTCISLFGREEAKLAKYKLQSVYPNRYRYLCEYHAMQVFTNFPDLYEFTDSEI